MLDKETFDIITEKLKICVMEIREIETILNRKKIKFGILGVLITKLYEAKNRWSFRDPS